MRRRIWKLARFSVAKSAELRILGMPPIDHDLIKQTLATAASFPEAAAVLGISESRLAQLMSDKGIRQELDEEALEMYHEFARRLQRSCDAALGVLRRAVEGSGAAPSRNQVSAARAIIAASKDVLQHFEMDVKLTSLRERVEKLQ